MLALGVLGCAGGCVALLVDGMCTEPPFGFVDMADKGTDFMLGEPGVEDGVLLCDSVSLTQSAAFLFVPSNCI